MSVPAGDFLLPLPFSEFHTANHGPASSPSKSPPPQFDSVLSPFSATQKKTTNTQCDVDVARNELITLKRRKTKTTEHWKRKIFWFVGPRRCLRLPVCAARPKPTAMPCPPTWQTCFLHLVQQGATAVFPHQMLQKLQKGFSRSHPH